MKIISSILAFIGLSASCVAATHKDMDVNAFAKVIGQPGVQILDVRTAEEFASGHISGSINLDVNEDSFAKLAPSRLKKDAPVAVYCRSGRRSANACSILESLGFGQVYNLSGGIAAWVEAGKPTSTSQVEDVIAARRSVRKYKSDRIDREVLEQIMNAGLNAPNGMGRQYYELRVIDDPALLAEISAAAYGDTKRSLFYGAPCVVFIANDPSYDLSQVDCGLLGENIILSALSRGISSICLGIPVREMKQNAACAPYVERLGFSDGYNFLYCIALGYADEAPAAKARKAEKLRFVK